MYKTIYWITRLDGIIGFAFFTAMVTAIAILFLTVFIISDDCDLEDKTIKKIKHYRNICFFLFPLSIAVKLFVPTQDEAILIFAGGKTYDYIQKDTSLQKIPFKTTEYIKLLLDKNINELKSDSAK